MTDIDPIKFQGYILDISRGSLMYFKAIHDNFGRALNSVQHRGSNHSEKDIF